MIIARRAAAVALAACIPFAVGAGNAQAAGRHVGEDRFLITSADGQRTVKVDRVPLEGGGRLVVELSSSQP